MLSVPIDYNGSKYIPQSDLITKSLSSSDDSLIICSICTNILNVPMVCLKCNKRFCKGCLKTWLESCETCPFRCGSRNFSYSEASEKILSNLKFICVNGCGESLSLKDITEHYKRNCPKINFKKKYFDLLDKFQKL